MKPCFETLVRANFRFGRMCRWMCEASGSPKHSELEAVKQKF